jgi:rSAM/selenodomain-associated transferase 2
MISVSIIIPVLHETGLDDFLSTLFSRFKQELYEVIVVDGDPLGRSIKSINRPDVSCLVTKTGRGPQMNAGARVAQGEVVLFLHSDTHLPDNALQKIDEVMSTDRFMAGAFTLRFNSKNKIFGLIARAASLRGRLTRIPYGDQAFFMKRTLFFKMGGFKEIALMEDIDLMQRLRKEGGRVRILADKVLTSPRRWEKEGILYSLLRSWLLAILFQCGVSPERLRRYYRSGPNKKGPAR